MKPARDALAGAIREQEQGLLNCVHCGFCLPACPTYRRLGDEADSPRGRLYLMQAVVEGRLDAGSDAFQTHIGRCLGCRACEPVCPAGVEYGHLLELARQVGGAARTPPLLARLLLRAFGTTWIARPAMFAARLLRASGIPGLMTEMMARHPDGGRPAGSPRMGSPGRSAGRMRRGFSRRAPGSLGAAGLAMAMLAASAPARELFHKRRERSPSQEGKPDPEPSCRSARIGGTGPKGRPATEGTAESAPGAAGRRTRSVGLLTGCVQAGLFARVNAATARVLEANGYRVVPVPNQGCCGALHAHGGDLEAARALARRNVRAFEAAGVDFVATNASGCGAAMAEYGALLKHDPTMRERASALARRVGDISLLLAERGPAAGAAISLRVTYDAPCHLLHAQGVADPPVRVLRSVPGLEVLPLDGAEECCGGAGIYSLGNPELGGRIGTDKVRRVLETGADALVTGNPGCMMQIGAGLALSGSGIPVLHLVEVVDESYRRGGLYRERSP